MESPLSPPPVDPLKETEPPSLPDDAPKTSVVIRTKPLNVVVLEGVIYFLISGLPPVAQLLLSDQMLSARSIIGTVLVGVVSGGVSLKAFFSQSYSNKN